MSCSGLVNHGGEGVTVGELLARKTEEVLTSELKSMTESSMQHANTMYQYLKPVANMLEAMDNASSSKEGGTVQITMSRDMANAIRRAVRDYEEEGKS